jgi:oligopeptide/dipeptide ABC transporter ATP-binding protein
MNNRMDPLFELKNITCRFKVKKDEILVLDGISLSLDPNELICLVGESGCGKTTTGKIITGLIKPTGGQMFYQGKNIHTMSSEEKKRFRLKVQMIHQDPYSALNPTQNVFEIMSAPLYRHHIVASEEEAIQHVSDLLTMVDLTPAQNFINKYPHQLSGGQRQRISIARSITVKPSLIVADEAVSMVDVSIRISILKTMKKLTADFGMAFVLITHDLALAKYFAGDGRIAVMYLGKIVEISQARSLIKSPKHPYTRALISALPEANPITTRSKERFELRSMDVPSLLHRPPGCVFHPRCPLTIGDRCSTETPELQDVSPGVSVACHLYSEHRDNLRSISKV